MAAMSQRAYAQHRGVSHKAVQKAIEGGRITVLPDGRIESDIADEQWDRNTREHAPFSGQDDDGSGFGATQYSKARAVREHYQARLAKLEYEERVGSLVSKDEVRVAAFNRDPAVSRCHAEHPRPAGGDARRGTGYGEVLRDPDSTFVVYSPKIVRNSLQKPTRRLASRRGRALVLSTCYGDPTILRFDVGTPILAAPREEPISVMDLENRVSRGR